MNVTYLERERYPDKGTNASAGRVFLTVFLLATLAFAGVALALGVLELPNTAHADAYHPEAVSARQAMRDGKCLSLQAHYSSSRGTVLILCQLSEDEWAGQVARVSMNGGQTFLADSCYECTLFVASWRYWSHVLVRDGYDTIPPELLDKLQAYMGG